MSYVPTGDPVPQCIWALYRSLALILLITPISPHAVGSLAERDIYPVDRNSSCLWLISYDDVELVSLSSMFLENLSSCEGLVRSGFHIFGMRTSLVGCVNFLLSRLKACHIWLNQWVQGRSSARPSITASQKSFSGCDEHCLGRGSGGSFVRFSSLAPRL